MKKTVKRILHRAGVLGPVQSLYFNLRSLTPDVVRHEIALSMGSSPDGYPLPPSKLIFDIIACRWRSVYLTSGRLIVDDLEAILNQTKRPLSSFGEILDFGCGCGRLTRQLARRCDAKISGSDYNPVLVAWCQQNLPFASFSLNDLLPPSPLSSSSFDLVLARSIFTHLPEVEQIAWMNEFRRIMQPGAFLYLTMHGSALANGLTQNQRESFDRGDLVVTYAELAGENICSTYASSAFVTGKLLDGFELVRHVEGGADAHLRQDVYVLERVG